MTTSDKTAQEINPIINLFKNHINKDIDQNFIDALEAVLFLTNATQTDFELTFSHKLANDVVNLESSNEKRSGKPTIADVIKSMNQAQQKKPSNSLWHAVQESDKNIFSVKDITQQHHSQEENTVSYKPQQHYVQYNPADFLVFKLVENLRRLYSASKAQEREEQEKMNKSPNLNHNSKSINHLFGHLKQASSAQMPMNNEKKLIENQSFIYKAFELIMPYTRLSAQPKWFEKAIFGKNIQVSPMELWAYLGLHEFVQPENRKLHNSILEEPIKSHRFSQEMLISMSKVIPPFEQKELIYTILRSCDINQLCDATFNNKTSKPTHSWTLSVCEFLFNPTNNISEKDFGDKQKSLALNTLLKFNLLDSPYYSKFINNNADFFDNMKFQTSSSSFKHIYKKSLQDLPFSHFETNKNTVDFLFKNIDSLDSVDFFTNTVKTKQINAEQKNKIFNLYDLDNGQFLKDVASKIDYSSGEMRDKSMEEFLTIGHNATNKELITHIISLNSCYMPICKAAYLKIRFSENLTDKTEQQDNGVITKRKI